MQAKDALKHVYFADLDKATIDLLENPEVNERNNSGQCDLINPRDC